MKLLSQPKGVLFDYGGTLVEEVGYDPRAGTEMLLARASYRAPGVRIEDVLERAKRVTREVASRRDEFQIETPWPSLTRLIHHFYGTRFSEPLRDLEVEFWDASVTTRPMPGARDAMDELHRLGIRMAVVSNSSFGHEVIRHDLAKHGLTGHLAFVMASADYSVRKPNPLLFETAAAMLGVGCEEIWFVGDRLDTDVAGARAAGMTAVWFGGSETGAAPEADVIAPTWAAFVEHIRSTSP